MDANSTQGTISTFRSGFELASAAVALALEYPNAKTIHQEMDALNTHRRKSLSYAFGDEMTTEVWDRLAAFPWELAQSAVP
jgi:hypothetical protein